MTEDVLKNFFADHDRIFIFGIGNYSAALAERLNELKLPFDGFIATSKTQADRFTQLPLEHFMDHRVLLIDDPEILMGGGYDVGCILALPEKYQPDAEKILSERGIKNFFRCTDDYMLSNVRRVNELTVELVDEFKKAIPFQPVEHKPKNILTVCLGGICDMILTTPFLRELKRNHPASRITLIITPITFELVEHLPFVDCVRAFDWKKNIGTLRARMLNAQNFVEGIMCEQNINAFDAAILPSWDIDLYGASFLIFFSRAAERIAYSEHVKADKERANKNFDLLFNVTLDDPSLRHESERGLQLLKHIGDLVVNRQPELYPLPEDHSTIDQLLKKCATTNCKLIILGVSATAPHRIWDQKNFSELINRLSAWRSDLKFAILGGQDATDKAHYIVENTPRGTVIDLTNKLTLRESAALCCRASIYVGNNTGTMHLAATAGMRCVEINNVSNDGDLFFADSAARTRPLGDGHAILQPAHALDDCVGYCRKPFAHCINRITVDEVVEEVKRIVEQK